MKNLPIEYSLLAPLNEELSSSFRGASKGYTIGKFFIERG
jgi:hypothetical protein